MNALILYRQSDTQWYITTDADRGSLPGNIVEVQKDVSPVAKERLHQVDISHKHGVAPSAEDDGMVFLGSTVRRRMSVAHPYGIKRPR